MNRPSVVAAILFFLQCWPHKRRKLRAGAGLAPKLGKQGKLEAFVRTWDRRYPHETEELFEWLRQSLTLVQVALGRLDFRKFIVRLSALSQGSGGGYLPHSELQQEFFCFDRESGCQRTAETMSASTTYSKFSLLASTHLSTYYCGFQ